MATLPTYGFNVRALPRLADIDPRDFRGGIPDFQQGFQGSLANIEGVLRNIMLDEQAKSTKRKGALEDVEQPYKVQTAAERAKGEANRVIPEETIKGVRTLDELSELGDERTQRQAERAQATQRATTGTVQSRQAQVSAEAIDSQITALAQAKAAAELAGDQTAAERAAQELVTLGARRDDLVRNAQLASQAERGVSQTQIEQNRSAAFQARIAQLPRKQRIVMDADGNQKIETYVEEPQANGTVRTISLGDSGITPKEDVDLKRAMSQQRLDTAESLAEYRRAQAENLKNGKPIYTQLKSDFGATAGIVQLIPNPETGLLEAKMVSGVPTAAGGGAPQPAPSAAAPTPTAQPAAQPVRPPAGAPRPNRTQVTFIRESATDDASAARARAIVDSKFWPGAYDYYMVNDE